jgi:hypothetical protein
VKTVAEGICSMSASSSCQELSLVLGGRSQRPTSTTLGTVAESATKRTVASIAFIRATTTSSTDPRFSRRRWTSSIIRRACKKRSGSSLVPRSTVGTYDTVDELALLAAAPPWGQQSEEASAARHRASQGARVQGRTARDRVPLFRRADKDTRVVQRLVRLGAPRRVARHFGAYESDGE